MRSIRIVAIVLAVLAGLASCSRDPEVVKKRYLESGNKYFDKGRYKEASIQYRNALKRDPKYGAAHYKLALVSLQMGDVASAVSSLRRALEPGMLPRDQPDYWNALVKLTELYLAYGNGEKALVDEVDTFTGDLLKHDPNSFDAHRLKADLNYTWALDAYKNKRTEAGVAFLDAATEEYRKADSIKPGQQGVSMQLARVLSAKRDFAGAEAVFRRTIEKDKTYQSAYVELYRLLVFQNKLAPAEELLKSAFANNPKMYGYLTLLAMHYYGQQRRDDMLNVLNQIKSHARDFDQAYLTVGDFYLRMGDGDAAIREYKEGLAKDTKDAKRKSDYRKRVIEVLMRQGKRSDAAEINAQILKETPNDNDARGLAATFLLDKGNIAQALAELQAVVTRAPDNPVSRYNLGRAHAAMGEAEQARQQYMKAIELRPDYVRARLALAQLQVGRGEFDAALKTAEAVLAIDKGNGSARLIESAALMGQKKFGDSHLMLDAMLKINPASPDVLFQLGVVNLAERKFKESEDAFRRAYQLNPANSRGLIGVVETYVAQNKYDEALKLLQAESDKAPNRSDLLMLLANTAVRAGKFDYGIQTFNRVLGQVEKGGKQGDLYLRIGETYRRKGDPSSAVQALQKARETLPANVVVLSTLGVVLNEAARMPEAKQVYEATLKIEPNNALVLNNLAFLLAETGGDLDDALTKATQAKRMLPALHEISDTLGWIYLKKNLPDSAIEIFKDLVSKEPSHSTYRYHLGMAYSQKGDKTNALDQLREALKYNPPKAEKDKIQQLITRLG
jgi:tetratricopeptide (TPR) repeat protein